METSYNCAKWCSATTYQKVNSSIVSKGAMNSFNEMFPQAMFPLVAMHKGSQNSLVCKFSSNTGINKTKLRFTLEGWVYGKRLKRWSIKAKNISFNFSNTYFRFPTGVKEC